MTTGDEIVACSVEELPPGTRHEVLGAAKYGITVFNIAGEFYALLNFCPHKGGPLCRGRVLPHAISNEAGHWKFERELRPAGLTPLSNTRFKNRIFQNFGCNFR